MEKHEEEVNPSQEQQASPLSVLPSIFTYLTLLLGLLGAFIYFCGFEAFQEGPFVLYELLAEKFLGQESSSHLVKRKEFIELIGFRILVGIGVFAVLNIVVIVVHHVVQKIARATNSYKNVDHVISPF